MELSITEDLRANARVLRNIARFVRAIAPHDLNERERDTMQSHITFLTDMALAFENLNAEVIIEMGEQPGGEICDNSANGHC